MAKYYYNGVLLPEIPADVIKTHPYVWIRKNGSTGYYDLLLATGAWYCSASETLNHNDSNNVEWYRVSISSADTAEEWIFNSSYSSSDWGDDANRVLMWSNHDIPNGSATSPTIYFYGSDPVPENEAKSKELEYAVYTNFYPSGSTITYAVSDLTINYVVPVKKYSTYTVTMTEVGNRLRVCYSTKDPATITANTSVTSITEPSSFPAGYTFTYFAQEDGWMVVYVSNAGERPKISIVTNGVGGDGAPLYDRKYLVRSGSTLYTITDGALTALAETEITASLFQTYGVDEIPDGALLAGLTDPEVLYWHDSTDELPDITITVKGTPPLPQMFTSEPMDLTHESIAGIDHAAVDASEDVRFAISFDGGTTWKAHDGSAWFDTSDTVPGMLPSTMNAITAEQWAEVVVLDSYMVRFWLPNVTAYVKSVVMHYINP